jgi:LmbE family N-acetylglucosaminyl deacetylase
MHDLSTGKTRPSRPPRRRQAPVARLRRRAERTLRAGLAALRRAPFDEVVGKLVAHLREIRPEVVVTYDGFGTTGHEDHIHAHRAALAAVETAAYEQLFPEAGEPHQVRRLAFDTVPQELARPILPGVGVAQRLITTTLDVSAWAERKWAAASAHESEPNRTDRIPAGRDVHVPLAGASSASTSAPAA